LAVVDTRAPASESAPSNPWLGFIARRLLGLVLVVFFLVFAVFMSVRLIPGDPAEALAFQITPQEVERARQEMGLDRPIHSQFVTYVGDLLHGDMGTSFLSRQAVTDVIRERAGNSLKLAGIALVVTLLIGVPLGMLMGALTSDGRHRKLDVGYQGATQFLATLPEFLVATVLAYLLAVRFQLLPVAGDEGWRSLVLPVLALVIGATASLSRFVRAETLNVLAQDYVRTARSKRLPARILYTRHVLPNVLTGALTIGGLLFAGLIAGAVIVENVFNRPGIGTVLTSALAGRDYPLIQGITLMLGAIVVITNAVVDVLLAVIDKRSLARES
jgi:peptide/nickel transport system permease protein